MIMMQTGMVKQGLNSASHTYIDGMNKRIQTSIVGFICKKKKYKYECAIYINDNSSALLHIALVRLLLLF